MDFTNCRDALCAIVKKVPRTYDFMFAEVRFGKIDFFGRVLPPVPPDEGTFPSVWRENWRTEFDSQIILARSGWPGGPFDASVWIDVTPAAGGEPLDERDYVRAMEVALGAQAIRIDDALHLDEAEQAEIAAANARCAPTIDQSRQALAVWAGCPEPLQWNSLDDCRDNKYSLAKPLKAALKQLGYRYAGYANFGYYFEKFNDKRHSVWIEIDTAPMCRRIDAVIHYRGLGFDHVLGIPEFTPYDQSEAQRYVDSLTATLQVVEERFFPALEEAHAPCPHWVRMPSIR